MAADTANTNNLALHLDKISYAAAGVLGLVVVLIPWIASGELRDKQRELEDGQSAAIIRQREDYTPPAPPDLVQTIQSQWTVNPAPEKWVSPWTTDVRPAILRLWEGDVALPPAHEPGKIVKIAYQRDPKKRQVFLRVEAARGKAERVTLTETKLLRREAKDGGAAEFQAAADLSDPLVYEDFDVEVGKLYAYRLDTEAEAAEPEKGGALPAKDKHKSSEPCALKDSIPYEYAFEILNAVGADPQTAAPPRLTGTARYWDYATGKTVRSPKSSWAEGDDFGPKLEDGKGRYLIRLIENNQIEVQDRASTDLRREPLSSKDNRRPVDLPADLVCGAEAAGAGAGEGAAPPPSSEHKPKAKPKAPKNEDDPAPPPPKKTGAGAKDKAKPSKAKDKKKTTTVK